MCNGRLLCFILLFCLPHKIPVGFFKLGQFFSAMAEERIQNKVQSPTFLVLPLERVKKAKGDFLPNIDLCASDCL